MRFTLLTGNVTQGADGDPMTVVRGYAEELATGRGEPYAIGRKIWSTAMGGVSPIGIEGEQCHALWLLWGALTDWIENKPDEKRAAEEAMRRAATEWLTVADSEPTWRAYFAGGCTRDGLQTPESSDFAFRQRPHPARRAVPR